MKNMQYIIISISVLTSRSLLAQGATIVDDPLANATLLRLFQGQEAQKIVQDSQHLQTIDQWKTNLEQLRGNWKLLSGTYNIVSRQIDFIKQIRNANWDDPMQATSGIFNNIDQELFSRCGIMSDISEWLKSNKSLNEWGDILESLFKPLNSNYKDAKAREEIRKLEETFEGIKRRQAIEKTYRETKEFRSKTITLRDKLRNFLKEVRAKANVSGTPVQLQKLGLQLAITEKGIEQAIGIGEDLGKRLMELKTLADNRDVMEEQLKSEVRKEDHKKASIKAAKAAKEMYKKSREPNPRITMSGGVGVDRRGNVKTRASVGWNVPLK